MQEKSLIKKNILKYLENKGITKYKFYKETGITRGVLDQNNGMSEENTARIIAYFPDINPEWLITGKGEMLKQTVQDSPHTRQLPNSQSVEFQGKDNKKNDNKKNNDSELIGVIASQQRTIEKLCDIIAGFEKEVVSEDNDIGCPPMTKLHDTIERLCNAVANLEKKSVAREDDAECAAVG